MLDFVALDFETANKFKNSACSLAVITVKDGQIIKKAYSLIKPPFMSFDDECIEIHGDCKTLSDIKFTKELFSWQGECL